MVSEAPLLSSRPTYDQDEILANLTRTRLPANQLAARFDEGALPGGRALVSLGFYSIDEKWAIVPVSL